MRHLKWAVEAALHNQSPHGMTNLAPGMGLNSSMSAPGQMTAVLPKSHPYRHSGDARAPIVTGPLTEIPYHQSLREDYQTASES